MAKKRKKALSVQEAGRRGGKSRAARHSAEQLSAWAKLGGRPPKKAEQAEKKGGK